MSLDPSERLKKHNASATSQYNGQKRECVSLFHSSFSQDWHLTTWNGGSFDANVRSESVTFIPHPFRFRLPDDTASGRFDMEVDFFNDAGTFMSELRAAASDATERVQLEYNVFLAAEEDSDISPLVLEVIRAPFTSTNCTILATRANIQNRKFPYMVYRPELFPGLKR